MPKTAQILHAAALILAATGFAQTAQRPNLVPASQESTFARINIPRVASAPTIADFDDMKPTTTVANSMLVIDRFIGRLPVDDVPSSERTQVYLGYDDTK